MDRITLQNYRCFGSEEQSARLAPLTLLVGPNSTGKTSFLALIRALWDVAFREVVPNFREEPYDLGSFEDIAYNSGGRNGRPDSFAASFLERDNVQFEATFAKDATAPFPIVRRFANDEAGFELSSSGFGCPERARYRIIPGEWQPWGSEERRLSANGLFPLGLIIRVLPPLDGNSNKVRNVLDIFDMRTELDARPFASAPMRARPRRTYDPSLLSHDSEGDYIPSYLANLSRRDADEWQLLKNRLEEFGRASELFDEISVRSPFGKSDGDPFQIQVRKPYRGRKTDRRKGPWYNLIDVGYGVSQALPVLTELLRPDGPTMFLLQQPEVHLHPQAQAALGTLFCQTAAAGRQLVIETHSDYIIDRVRMDVRDGTTELKPEDVSILYFEPGDLSVKVHSVRLDKLGNVLDAPPSYGKFFMDEVNRSIGLVKPDVRNR